MAKKEIMVNWGGHSSVKVVLETDGPETKVKFETENADKTILVIAEKDQKEFIHDLQQLFGRFYI